MPLTLDTILVGTDLSPASQAAVTYALQLAQALEARLLLVHVVPEEDIHLLTSISQHLQSDLPATALTDVCYRTAEQRLAPILAEATAMGLAPESHILTGNPTTALLQCATEQAVHVLILGTHGRRGLEHFVMGSVAAQVLQQAPCAVIVVPPAASAPASAV